MTLNNVRHFHSKEKEEEKEEKDSEDGDDDDEGNSHNKGKIWLKLRLWKVILLYPWLICQLYHPIAFFELDLIVKRKDLLIFKDLRDAHNPLLILYYWTNSTHTRVKYPQLLDPPTLSVRVMIFRHFSKTAPRIFQIFARVWRTIGPTVWARCFFSKNS